MRTLYISDLDGTLLNNKAELSPKATRELNDLINQGISFTYATGRSWASASKVMKNITLNLPVITHNGTFICKPKSGEVIRVFSMSADKFAKIRSILMEHNVHPLVYTQIDNAERLLWVKGNESDETRSFLELRRGDKRLLGVDSWHDLSKGMTYEILVIGSYNKLASLAVTVANEAGYSIIFTKDHYIDQYLLEIYDEKASKAAGIEWLRKNYDFDKIICFGDNLNDISMFKAADEAYAPENALPELKQIATGVIGSNENSSVVEFIKKHVKGD